MKIDFEFETPYGKFADALYLPDDHSYTDAEIQAMKQHRLNKWLSIIAGENALQNQIIVDCIDTPKTLLVELIKQANITRDDVFYDLGCGDGSVLIEAAKYGASCFGVEANIYEVNACQTAIANAGLNNRIVVVHGDLFEQDLSAATVVYLFLTQQVTEELESKLFALQPGTKIITFLFMFPNHLPDCVVNENTNTGYIWIVK